MHRDLTKRAKLAKIWKINDNFQGGVPDAFYLAAAELWVEYKHIVPPKRSTTLIVPDVSDLQYGWLEALQDADKQAWVVVTHGSGRSAKAWVESDLERVAAGITQAEFLNESLPYQVYLDLVEETCADRVFL